PRSRAELGNERGGVSYFPGRPLGGKPPPPGPPVGGRPSGGRPSFGEPPLPGPVRALPLPLPLASPPGPPASRTSPFCCRVLALSPTSTRGLTTTSSPSASPSLTSTTFSLLRP